MFILMSLAVLVQDVPVGTDEMAAVAATVRKCAPDIDPNTGQMYPMCAPSIKSRFDLGALDITTDAYERAARLARREGLITSDQLSEKMGRVREARALHDKLSRDF